MTVTALTAATEIRYSTAAPVAATAPPTPPPQSPPPPTPALHSHALDPNPALSPAPPPPLRNTLISALLRDTVSAPWAALLQDLHWRPWLHISQIHISYLLSALLPCWAKAPTLLQLLLILPVTLALIGIAMSVCLHRYFSHQAFTTSRPFQFVLGVVACLAYQLGPLWWAGKHGRHHKHCDTPMDPHSICQRGFWYSWVGWSWSAAEYPLDTDYIIPAFAKCPELQFLDTFWSVPVVAANLAVWKLSGSYEAMVYGLLIPMTLCRLITLLFNVIFHIKGQHSQSSAQCKAVDIGMGICGAVASLVGEDQHKHHHHHPRAAHRPGLDLPWQLSVRLLAALGLVWDCK